MSVKQISVFIENKKGALASCTRFIADHNINIPDFFVGYIFNRFQDCFNI